MTNREYINNFTNWGEKSLDEKFEISKMQLAYAIARATVAVISADKSSDALEIAYIEIRRVLDESFSGNQKIESDNLKGILFKEAFERFHAYDEGFDALLTVIRNADLEDEYLEWVKKENNHG